MEATAELVAELVCEAEHCSGRDFFKLPVCSNFEAYVNDVCRWCGHFFKCHKQRRA